ncbi:MAG: polysaccharide deacetylase family protein [Oscillospiraceae bacterium]|nr:polysaccharide deacetylase family protein [Oscillospiraceae bacterium]
MYFILNKKNILYLIIIIVFICASIIPNNYNLYRVVVNNIVEKKPIYRVGINEKKIALGFNAAWDNRDTQSLVDIFNKYDVKTTFFVTGEWVDKYPNDVKYFFDSGHDIGNHSDFHPHVSKISEDKLIKDTLSAEKKIENIIGKKPSLYRAPYGEYSNSMIETLKEKLGYDIIQWDVDSRDWKPEYTSEKIIKGVLNNIDNGSILLFHNGKENTIDALPIILEGILSRGYKIILIKDLIPTGSYIVDNFGEAS